MLHFTGSVILFAGNYAPYDWLPCDGRALDVKDYVVLFSIIGNTYGGDGITHFNLPKLNSKTATDQDHHDFMLFMICIHGAYPMRP